ncbi:MAG: single-stranded DNA-binding protein [Minisyncoccia bacterium]
MNINKALIFGNLTRDPEVRSLPSGIQVSSLSIATNRTWKDKEGKKQDSVDYHNVVAFGKQAEIIAQYCRKGSSLFVEGRIQTRSWEDKTSGEKKYRTEIVIENFQFGPKRTGSDNSSADKSQDVAPDSSGEEIEYPQENIQTDDIPF